MFRFMGKKDGAAELWIWTSGPGTQGLGVQRGRYSSTGERAESAFFPGKSQLTVCPLIDVWTPGHCFLARSHMKQTCLVTHFLGSLLGAACRQREARRQQVNSAPDGRLPHPAGIRTDSEDRVSYHCCLPCSPWQLPLGR